VVEQVISASGCMQNRITLDRAGRVIGKRALPQIPSPPGTDAEL
jgi:hypothetical protein